MHYSSLNKRVFEKKNKVLNVKNLLSCDLFLLNVTNDCLNKNIKNNIQI